MQINSVTLSNTIFSPREVPRNEIAKIIFCGRSNVGKSSLINMLMRRKGLARTSSSPGKTASINYYLINESFFFVDLPGYGYSKLSRSDKERIAGLMEGFFARERSLKLALLLIDVRVGLLEVDLQMLEMLREKKIPLLTLLTKSDKLSFNQVKNKAKSLANELKVEVIPVSVKNQKSREEVLNQIKKALEEKQCTP